MIKPPGKILAENFMLPLGLKASQLAKGMNVNRSTIHRLIEGKLRIGPSMAARLGAYFQVPPKWWLQMQIDYDAQQIVESSEWTRAISPLAVDPDVLLTPTGVLRFGSSPSLKEERILLKKADLLLGFESSSLPTPRKIRQIRYDNGSIALVGDET